MIKHSETGPRLMVNITDQEKATAKDSKREFKAVLKELRVALRVISELKSSILEQHPSKDDLKTKYRGRLLRYKKRIVESFNVFLSHLKQNLGTLSLINDPDTQRLREVLGAEVSELSDGVEAILDLLQDSDKDNFTQKLDQLTTQLEKRERSINDAIGNQLFNHIDHDMLGKMRISQLQFNIHKRSRLLLQAMRR